MPYYNTEDITVTNADEACNIPSASNIKAEFYHPPVDETRDPLEQVASEEELAANEQTVSCLSNASVEEALNFFSE
jgi:hypothetical protein